MSKLLNRKFSLGNNLGFDTDAGGLTFARIQNQAARASICLQGAHVVDFTPAGSAPVLWMSSLAKFEHGTAIRGGVPVMWPWFGAKDGQPQHGFVRTLTWQVVEARQVDGSNTVLVLALSDTASTRENWPHGFDLRLEIHVGEELGVALTAWNTGHESIEAGGGFHPYLNVGDAGSIRVRGLSGCEYLDKVKDYARYPQDGDLRFLKEIDRVYVSTKTPVVVSDPVLGRRIRIEKTGSETTVVWNPWKDAARSMTDFPDTGYENMVCVEAVNAFDDVRKLVPGASHTIAQTISVQPL